jgi:hypothetical protein
MSVGLQNVTAGVKELSFGQFVSVTCRFVNSIKINPLIINLDVNAFKKRLNVTFNGTPIGNPTEVNDICMTL